VPSSDIKRRLEKLWVSRVRTLAQGVHELIKEWSLDQSEGDVYNRLRESVREILCNMVNKLGTNRRCTIIDVLQIMLGSTKVKMGTQSDILSQHYVPGFATMTFAMIKHFVSYVGFTRDEDPSFREDLFDAVSFLQCSMVAAPGYLFSPHEAPGFNSESADPIMYGIGRHIKASQIQEMRSNGKLGHDFG
jgi:hypothetical protein